MKSNGAGCFVFVGVAALVYIGYVIASPLMVINPIGVAILVLGCVSIIIGMIKLGFGEDEVKKKKAGFGEE